MWCKRRHKIVTAIFRPVFKLHFKLKYNLDVKVYKELNYPALILSNHVTSLDPFIVGSFFKQPLYYMASTDLFQHFFLGKLIKFLVNPIPKMKSKKSDLTAIKSCIKVAKENGTICIFPEGNRTVTGKLGYVDKSIAKLAKTLKLPIVLFNIHGGYGTEPRWGQGVRKGKMHCEIKKVLSYDDYKDLELDELYDIIVENLSVDDLNYYNNYKSKNKAMYLERVLYVCPVCGAFHALKSKGNKICCVKCGLEVAYQNDLTFISGNDSFKFKNVDQWYNYQIDIVVNKNYSDDECIYEENVFLSMPRLYKSRKKLGYGELSIYPNRFEVSINKTKESYVFEFDNIEAVTYLGKKKMNIYYNGETYQIFNKVDSNFLKYVHMFYILKNKKEEKENNFIGL
ncbi:MAG: 1-acyl-sn-glycerol-3-phosphate acyltransferase [Bacilli bacterium]|nr:1-acyl-sn-glycerol-3-phosphate acyltransferase [Bacilli bacterium]